MTITQTVRRNAFVGLGALLIVATAFGTSVSAQFGSRRNGNGNTGITVFTNPNYGGESASFRDNTPTLVPYGLNDKISSIQITDGGSWEVCQDINYANRCQVITGDVPNLSAMGWNDRISSLRRVGGGGYNNGGNRNDRDDRNNGVFSRNDRDGLLFFDRTNFRGSSTFVNNGTQNLNFDVRGSVQVRGGGSWEVCDRTGRCSTVTQDVSDLSRLGLNGRITVVRPANGRFGGYRR